MILSKYSANGNDFIIFHSDVKDDRIKLAIELCNRQDGIGADGLIVIVPHDTYDFEWQFYNSDGSTAEMCGNGTRACAHYAFVHGLAPKNMSFLTKAGIIKAEVDADCSNSGMVLSELTPPLIIDKDIIYNKKSWWLINTGVPHLVSFTNNIEEFDLADARDLRYIYNSNVNIVFIDGKNLKVRTYERGVEDETLACGTGMAACYYRALCENKIDKKVKVYPKSGDTLYLGMNDRTITFKGRVKNTFNTEW